MIVSEFVDSGSRIRHYSDLGVMIRQVETGAVYEDAVDAIPCKYTYEETDIPIEHEEQEVIDDALLNRAGELPVEQ